mgnify:CR=1 FL=1
MSKANLGWLLDLATLLGIVALLLWGEWLLPLLLKATKREAQAWFALLKRKLQGGN